MALLKPKQKSEKEQIRVSISADLIEEIKKYNSFSGLSKLDDFFEQAATFVLNKDKEFKDWKNKNNS